MLIDRRHILLFVMVSVATARAEEGLSYRPYLEAYLSPKTTAITGLQFDPSTHVATVSISTTETCRFTYQGEPLPFDGQHLTVQFPIEDSESIINVVIDASIGDRQSYIELEYRSPAFFTSVGRPDRKRGFLTLSSDLPRLRHHANTYLDVNHRDQLRQMLQFDQPQSLSKRDRSTHAVRRVMELIHEARACQGDAVINGVDGYTYLKASLEGTSQFRGCGSTSVIVRDCLRALDIPARNVAMYSDTDRSGSGPIVIQSQGHTTNELCVDGAWQWFDAYLGFLYARDAQNDKYLNTWELIEYLADPVKKAVLRVATYDPATGASSESSLEESPSLRHVLERFFTTDKDLVFSE